MGPSGVGRGGGGPLALLRRPASLSVLLQKYVCLFLMHSIVFLKITK